MKSMLFLPELGSNSSKKMVARKLHIQPLNVEQRLQSVEKPGQFASGKPYWQGNFCYIPNSGFIVFGCSIYVGMNGEL